MGFFHHIKKALSKTSPMTVAQKSIDAHKALLEKQTAVAKYALAKQTAVAKHALAKQNALAKHVAQKQVAAQKLVAKHQHLNDVRKHFGHVPLVSNSPKENHIRPLMRPGR